ncbi:DUF4271 domain-containing protein [uncultured Polaribacter sp.]|uniref:DUF4271 domain-containing protein n=1 Tax=uncultured Polaribacter sp. TaxID=174711 RepID=UPI00344EC5DF
MQALEKTYTNDNWITLIIVFLLLLIFLLKIIDHKKLKGYAMVPFYKNFIDDELEKNISLFNGFQMIISLFSIITLSFVCYKISVYYSKNYEDDFFTFLIIFGLVLLYFFVKWMLEYLLSTLFAIRKNTRFFLVSKFSYLYFASFVLFVGIIIVQYSQLETVFLINSTIIIFFLRFILHFIYNKKLIFSKLFYFILYFCAFEIAPLLILFKLMF